MIPAPPPAIVQRRPRCAYQQTCASCHGADLRGGVNAPSLRGVGAADVDFWVGTGRMPAAVPWIQVEHRGAQLPQETIDAIVAYVTSVQPGGEPIPAGRGGRRPARTAARCSSRTASTATASTATAPRSAAPTGRLRCTARRSPRSLKRSASGPATCRASARTSSTRRQLGDVASYVESLDVAEATGGAAAHQRPGARGPAGLARDPAAVRARLRLLARPDALKPERLDARRAAAGARAAPRRRRAGLRCDAGLCRAPRQLGRRCCTPPTGRPATRLRAAIRPRRCARCASAKPARRCAGSATTPTERASCARPTAAWSDLEPAAARALRDALGGRRRGRRPDRAAAAVAARPAPRPPRAGRAGARCAARRRAAAARNTGSG